MFGKKPRDYVRQLIIGYEPRESPPADYFAMARELKEIGSNMNQIAFMANATGLVNEAGYYENVIQLRDALRCIEMAAVGDGSEENFTDN